MLFDFSKCDFEVFTLYKYDTIESIDKNLFEKIKAFLENNYRLSFKFMSFNTNKFNKDHLYQIEKGIEKISDIGWVNLVSITLYENDLRKNKFQYSFKIAATNNPSCIVIFMKREFEFNKINFLLAIKDLFVPDYGFNYYTDNSEWKLAYSYTRYFKISKMEGVSRLSKFDNQSFAANNKKVCQGYFRDIYYFNVLNEKHMNQRINETHSLKEYISSSSIGVMDCLYGNLYFWILNKEQIKIVSQIIQRNGYFI